MNNKQRKIRGFTLIELLVAVGILAMMMSFASVIFRVSVGSQRTAAANAEIMQRFRAITDQLNRDFKGFIRDAPVAFAFDVNDGIRSDRVVFFSNGDFQSTRQYSGKTVAGNVARIYYGQSSKPDPNTNNPQDFRKVILARRAQILTDTDPNDPDGYDECDEYVVSSLSEWKLLKPPDQAGLSNWIGRPNVQIDSSNPNQIQKIIPMFMAKGVHNFKIQLMQDFTTDGSLQWWPIDDLSDNDYGTGYPPAIMFTFTLYDSRGVIKNGRTFTHIVCLE